MADEFVETVETVDVREGWVSVDYAQTPDPRKRAERQALLDLFEPVILRARDNNDVVVGKIEVALCKQCQALLRPREGELVRHARWHRRLKA